MKINIKEILYDAFEMIDKKGDKHYTKIINLKNEFKKKLTVDQLNEFKIFMGEYEKYNYYNCKTFGIFVLNFLRNVFNK